MDTFLAQLPALIGVALGVIGTLATTMVTDAARWRRERFYDACLRFLAGQPSRMRAAAKRMEGFARVDADADAEFDRDGWDSEALKLRRARDVFYAAARSRMGVKGLSTSSSLIHRGDVRNSRQ